MPEYVAGKGTTALGIIGTTLGGLAAVGGNLLGGLNGMGYNTAACSDNMPVSRYELGQQDEISKLRSENDLLKADKYTDQKLTEVYATLNHEIGKVKDELRDVAVYQATNTATIGCLSQQVNGLQQVLGSITKTVVGNDAICPGWGTAKVSIVTDTTTTTA